jgi:predicted TIM-barrel fold metal-dependent hydrolase
MKPDFPIADAHQHFWDIERNYHPWLRDEPPIPFRYGDYRAIRRRYLPADYLADAASHQVVRTVYVEAEWDPADPIGETRYIERLRAQTGLPTVMVAQAWLDRDDCAAVLEQQGSFGFVRSIRHKPRANASAGDGAPGGMTDPAWRAGFARLAPAGLHFDLQTPWWHLAEAAALAADFPDTTIILNHTGLPSDRSPDALAAWKQAIGRLAACPNAMIKISGLGQPGQAWTVAANRGVVLAAIEAFGVERSMFASNFPVDSLCASFDTIFSGFRQIVADFAAHEQRALFHDNAVRIYRME